MSEHVTIEKARLAERPALIHIGLAAWQYGILPLMGRTNGETPRQSKRITNYVTGAMSEIIVAHVDREPVGWCSRTHGRAYIPYLFVSPPFQGRGVGGMLLNRMESMLELEGHQRVLLETPADHVRAVHFYEKHGYYILAMKADGRSGHEPLMSVRLEKRLSPYKGPVGDSE